MKPTLDASHLEILPASAVTEMVKRAATRPLEILYPHTDANGNRARTLTADTPSKATYSRPFATRSHKHYSRESED